MRKIDLLITLLINPGAQIVASKEMRELCVINPQNFRECYPREIEKVNIYYNIPYIEEMLKPFENLLDLNIKTDIGFPFELNIRDGDFKKLYSLEIVGSKIKDISNVEYLKNLGELILNKNNIGSIPQNIRFLKYLSILNLSFNNLENVPEEIGYLSRLTNLIIKGNKIRKFPDNLARLQNLTTLNLDNNRLEEIPECVYHMKNLKKLILPRNNIKEIGNEIENLAKLTHLDLSNNNITFVSPCIKYLCSLTFLDLSYNYIRDLPDSIAGLGNLTWFCLNNNRFTHVPKSLSEVGSRLSPLNTLYGGALFSPLDLVRSSLRKTCVDMNDNNITDVYPLTVHFFKINLSVFRNPLGETSFWDLDLDNPEIYPLYRYRSDADVKNVIRGRLERMFTPQNRKGYEYIEDFYLRNIRLPYYLVSHILGFLKLEEILFI